MHAADIVGRPEAADEPLRVLYLRDSMTVCGPGKTMLNTWRTIDRNRFALTIAATRPAESDRNALLDAARRLGATAADVSIGRGVDLVGVWQLVRLLRHDRIDILQTHDAQTRRMGALAAAVTHTTHVTSVHGWIFNHRKERAAKWLDARLIRRADAVIAVSDRLRAELEGAGVPPERITVLRNAILLKDYAAAPDRESSTLRRRLGLEDSHPIVSIIGRLSPEKGHDAFLRAARVVANQMPGARFLIVGAGPLEAQLARRVAELNLGSQVSFLGHREDLREVYQMTDLLVISSLTEGLPNVLLEAFAHGKPAVATAVGGIPEILRDGETGRLVAPDADEGALAAAALSILTDACLRRRMGEAARATIERELTFEHRTRELERLYERTHEAASSADGGMKRGVG